jgi:hypothetical protein
MQVAKPQEEEHLHKADFKDVLWWLNLAIKIMHQSPFGKYTIGRHCKLIKQNEGNGGNVKLHQTFKVSHSKMF